MNRATMSAYGVAGVDDETAARALKCITARFEKTWPAHKSGTGSVRLPFGHFATVIEVEGSGIALCTDGVGTKALIAQMVGKYDTIGIDCVAMNVNDLLCVGARPLSMVDLMAVESPRPDFLDEISRGLYDGARQANVSIPGGEIAQLKDMIRGHREGFGFDLSGTAIGVVDLDRIIDGRDIDHGDAVIGVESNGIHSNGLTLARRAFFGQHDFSINKEFSELDAPLGAELLKPTHIYVIEVLEVLADEVSVKALVHVTGDGFLNLLRVGAEVGYVIDDLPPVPPIFSLIQKFGNVPQSEMFSVYNMGIGFCLIVDNADTDRTLSIIKAHGRQAQIIGHADKSDPGTVSIPEYGLKGTQKEKFFGV